MQDTNIEENKTWGFVKLWRSIKNWEWYTCPNTSHLFIHLLLTANYIDKPWRGSVIERGQYVGSLAKLGIETGLSVSQVRTSLDRLMHSNEIVRYSTNNYTVITIVKYDLYQDADTLDRKPIANRSQTDRKPIATTKESKEGKEGEERVTLAFSFLKLNYKLRLDHWEVIYKPQLVNYEKFIGDFNDTVLMNRLPLDPDQLLSLLTRLAKGYIKNEHKFR